MFLFEVVLATFGELDEFLRLVRAADRPDRHHQPAADPELLFERRRNPLSARGDQDGIELTVIGPPSRPVALTKIDVAVAELSEPGRGLRDKRSMPFDGANLLRQL